MLARGPRIHAESFRTCLRGVDDALFVTPADTPFAASPGEAGSIALGSTVVPVLSTDQLRRGVACVVVALGDGTAAGGPKGFCKLRRLHDGHDLRDSAGLRQWYPVCLVAPAGGSLVATPVLLACLWCCPAEVVAMLLARAPEAAATADAHGRTPMTAATEVVAFEYRPYTCSPDSFFLRFVQWCTSSSSREPTLLGSTRCHP